MMENMQQVRVPAVIPEVFWARGCADDPEDWCIGVGDMADYLVETNKGHYITREKVMEILQRAEG